MQMKKHWKLLGILLILITGLSCSDNESFEYNNYAEEPTVQNKDYTNHLTKDFRFIEYVHLNKNFIESIDYSNLDIELIEDLINRDDLTNEELEILAKAIGYEDIDSFKSFNNYQNKLILELDKEFHILSLSEVELYDSVLLVLNDDNNTTYNMGCFCDRKRSNCQMNAVAQLVLANIGCAAADVTIILGLMCHAAATTYGSTMLNNCELEYQICKKNCG